MENRKRERIIEAGMALLLVITLLAAGQSGKIPVVKSQEIQVQADSGKENESKEKGNTENTDSETTGTEKNSGDTGKNESGSDMESVAVAASAAQYPIMGKSDVSVQEMVDMVTLAFDKADEYRMPAMILADGLLGQMMEPVTFPEPLETLPDKSDWATNGHQNKRAHHIINSLYLDPAELEAKVKERFKRYAIVEEKETRAESYLCDDAEIVVTAYGASARVAKSAVNTARKAGIKAGLFRPITLWPFPKKELQAATKSATHILDVEMSMGQMVDDVRLATECRIPVSFFGRTGDDMPSFVMPSTR